MEEEIRNNNNILNGLFRNSRYENNDNVILIFLIIFLLLFTNFGCCNN